MKKYYFKIVQFLLKLLKIDVNCELLLHLIFATTKQLELLSKSWYIDAGTFKVVRATLHPAEEKAMWAAVRSVLPGVTLMGCAFHWTQALWRKSHAPSHQLIGACTVRPLCTGQRVRSALEQIGHLNKQLVIRTNNDIEGWHNGLNRPSRFWTSTSALLPAGEA
ncbi:hypothetical protein QZH41_020563 [Actinostola sp. cb2023]|nr:hypothetical protein QZH41_020563 [Actinostola sp. cb2023]